VALWLFLVFVLFDLQNLLSRCRRVLTTSARRSGDFTVLVPLYGHPRYFANADYLSSLKADVLLVVNTSCSGEMSRFAAALEADGWRVHRTQFQWPSAPAMLLDSLEAGVVDTTYVVRLDGDSSAEEDLGCAVAAAADAGADLASVKIVAANRSGLIEQLQGVEYEMAMLGRHVRPWLTSGACMIAKTASLLRILRSHSLWFYGEDMETGVIAKRVRMRVCHVDFRVFTDVPSSVRAWLRQRRGWWAGNFRQTFVNADHMVRYPTWLAYNMGLVWLLLFGKLEMLGEAAYLLPLITVVYTGVSYAANWQVRSRWMILYPYYALAQALVLPTVGAFYYLYLASKSGRVGRYRIAVGTA
jgi:Glycosyl transferase family group 2